MPSAHEILVSLKAQYAGKGDIQQLTNDLQSIKKIDSFKGLQENFMRLNGEFVAAKDRMRQLRAEMNQPGNGAMVAEYEKVKASSDKLFSQIVKNKSALDSQREALRQSGVEVTNLAGEYDRLKQSVDKLSTAKAAEQTLGLKAIRDVKAEIAGAVQAYRTLSGSGQLSAAEQARALEALRKKTKELYATIATAPKLDAARATLGLDSGRSIDLQINKVKRAYAELSASGKLSMGELAQAKVALGRRIDELRGKTNSWRDSLLQAKGNLVEAAAAGAALFGAAKAGIAFETSMADVKKVVEGTPAQLKQLADELQGMTRTIPLTAEELAKIAAAGGQLGIASKDISGFVKVTSVMSTAFNMTADEAGDAIGKLKTVLGLSVAEMTSFGDAINHIGDNSASKEKQIVDVMLRIGGASKQFGLAKEQAAALAGSMISLGRTPETAATGINALLTNMQTATMGSKDFKEALGKIGISAEEMATAVERNPQKAINNLLTTLQKLDSRKQAEVIVGLFGREYYDDISQLVQGLGEYERILGLVADKSAYAGSMQKTFNERAATTGNQLVLLKNAVIEIATNIGTALLPAIKGVAKALTEALHPVADLTKAFPNLSAAIVALGTGAVVFKTITKVVDIAKLAMGAFGASSVESAGKVSSVMKGLGTVFRWVGGAIGAAFAGYAVGTWLSQFDALDPVKKGFLSLIHTMDLARLAAVRLWRQLTGGDVAEVERNIAAAKQAYSELVAEIEKPEAEKNKPKEGEKPKEETSSQSPSTANQPDKPAEKEKDIDGFSRSELKSMESWGDDKLNDKQKAALKKYREEVKTGTTSPPSPTEKPEEKGKDIDGFSRSELAAMDTWGEDRLNDKQKAALGKYRAEINGGLDQNDPQLEKKRVKEMSKADLAKLDKMSADQLTEGQRLEREERYGDTLSTSERRTKEKEEKAAERAKAKEEREREQAAKRQAREEKAQARRGRSRRERHDEGDQERQSRSEKRNKRREYWKDEESKRFLTDDEKALRAEEEKGFRDEEKSEKGEKRKQRKGGGISAHGGALTKEEWSSLSKEQKDTLTKKASQERKSYDYFNAGKLEKRFRGDTDIRPELAREAKSMLEQNRIQAEQKKFIDEKIVTLEERQAEIAEKDAAADQQKAERLKELAEQDKQVNQQMAENAKKAEEGAMQANRARTELARKTAEERAQSEIQATEKAKSVFQRYADRVRQLQNEIAGREKSLAEDLDELDTTTPAEIKWKRKAKAAKDYEEAAKKAMAAGKLDQALSLSDQAKSLYSSLKDTPSGISESLARLTAARGIKSSGLLGLDISKMLQGDAAKSAMEAIPARLFSNIATSINSQLAAIAEGGSRASVGKPKVDKVYEIRHKGGSLRAIGSQSDVESFLDQLAQAGMSAS